MKKGIDISYCQRNIDFDKAKQSGIDFVIIRTGYLGKTDDRFYEHIKGALAAGLDVGAYCYQMAKTADEAVKEAEETVSIIGSYPITYPVFYDMEDSRLLKLTKEQRTETAIAFLETIRKNNFYPAIYTTPSWLNNFLCSDRLKKYDLWLAAWTYDPSEPTKYNMGQTMWQWGLDDVKGVKNKVDGDICYVDYPEIIREKGLLGRERLKLTNPAFVYVQPTEKSPCLAKCKAGEEFVILRGKDVINEGFVWKKAVKGNSYGWIKANFLDKTIL